MATLAGMNAMIVNIEHNWLRPTPSIRMVMQPLYDYFYRFPHDSLQMSGRCRVRIYPGNRNAHTVLLTELSTNAGESISSASTRIATDLAATKRLQPRSTRWIQHEPAHDDQPDLFEEVQFTWDSAHTASEPQWQPLDAAQVEAWTGESLSALSRRLGDPQPTADAVAAP